MEFFIRPDDGEAALPRNRPRPVGDSQKKDRRRFEMSRTFGHKRNHLGEGIARYRTAKPWRTAYNRTVRHLNRVRVDSIAPFDDDVIFINRNETTTGNLYNHPGGG
jgi:hypothetical protein